MRHACRVAHERLDSAQALRKCNELQVPEERAVVKFFLQDEGNHRAGPVCLLLLHRVAGIAGKPRKINFRHVAACLQPLCDAGCICHMAVHPDPERFDPADHQKAVEGGEHAADGVL